MTKKKTELLPEFPSEWHQERYAEDLERELAGRLNRKAELESMGVEDLSQVEAEIEAAEAELRRIGGTASTRPRKAAETR